MIKPGLQTLEVTRLSKYSADFVRQPAYRTSSSCRETIEDSHKVFHSSYTSPDAGSSGRATLLDSDISAVIGEVQGVFISGQLKVIPLFRYSVIPYSIFHIPHFTDSRQANPASEL